MLDRCLTAVSESDLRPGECVVVQDGSTDDSAAVAERHGARLIVLHEQQGLAQPNPKPCPRKTLTQVPDFTR
jgi:glycosyltransferase involved in cell wall biosynthesis